MALAKEFRKYRPRLVLGLGSRTPMASPDHYQAMLITEAAVFYSRLTKWPEHFGALEPHTISTHLHYFLAFRSLAPPSENVIVNDIGSMLERKIAAVEAYKTQFPPEKAGLFDRIRAYNRQQGMAAGFEAGEAAGPHDHAGNAGFDGVAVREVGGWHAQSASDGRGAVNYHAHRLGSERATHE